MERRPNKNWIRSCWGWGFTFMEERALLLQGPDVTWSPGGSLRWFQWFLDNFGTKYTLSLLLMELTDSLLMWSLVKGSPLPFTFHACPSQLSAQLCFLRLGTSAFRGREPGALQPAAELAENVQIMFQEEHSYTLLTWSTVIETRKKKKNKAADF